VADVLHGDVSILLSAVTVNVIWLGIYKQL
jgi:hypothetical protein